MTTIAYDRIAGEYDRRYELYDYPGIRAVILETVNSRAVRRVLEVGCGTGRWTAELARAGCDVSGIDPSTEMLARASSRVVADLCQGSADALPWVDDSFDAVFYINSLHHIPAPADAVCEAFRVLRPGGTLLSVGLDPHEKGGRWYVYEFFPETIALDLGRFPSVQRRLGWMQAAGFTDVSVRIAERLQSSSSLPEALQSGILQQSFTSQLTALSAAEYAAGIDRIRDAAAKDKSLRLYVDLTLYATTARKPV